MAKVISIDKPINPQPAWLGMLFRGILIAAAGGFIIFYTDNFIRLLTIAIGAWLIVSGIITVVGAFRIKEDNRRRGYAIARSLLNIVIGALAVLMPFFIAQTYWVVLLFIVAIQLCIAAVLEILIGLRLRSAGLPASGAFMGALISLAIAVVLFLAPEFLGALLIKWIGGLILLLGLVLIGYSFRLRKRSKTLPI